jgi:hypothetical protein
MDLEAFELVLLRRPASARDYPDEELERIQREHLGYLADLRVAGHIVTNGPVVEQPTRRCAGWRSTGPARSSGPGSWPRTTRRCGPGGWRWRS